MDATTARAIIAQPDVCSTVQLTAALDAIADTYGTTGPEYRRARRSVFDELAYREARQLARLHPATDAGAAL